MSGSNGSSIYLPRPDPQSPVGLLVSLEGSIALVWHGGVKEVGGEYTSPAPISSSEDSSSVSTCSTALPLPLSAATCSTAVAARASLPVVAAAAGAEDLESDIAMWCRRIEELRWVALVKWVGGWGCGGMGSERVVGGRRVQVLCL